MSMHYRYDHRVDVPCPRRETVICRITHRQVLRYAHLHIDDDGLQHARGAEHTMNLWFQSHGDTEFVKWKVKL
jgi:hypothetical protein